MQSFSYNETKNRQIKLRHIFMPGWYGCTCEIVIGVVALLLFNISELSNQLLAKNFDNADPLPVWGNVFKNLLDGLQTYDWVQHALLFLLWAMVGALLYIFTFRLLQVFFGVKHSLGSGLRFVQKDRAKGIFYWLTSLHDFFLTAIIVILGTVAILLGSVVCFGIASQELSNGLTSTFPMSMWQLLLSVVAAVLSVRFIALGLSLLSSRFRNWYTS